MPILISRRFRSAERGQGVVEWILIIAFVVIMAMVALIVFRNKVGGSMASVNQTVSGWSEGSGSNGGGGSQAAGSPAGSQAGGGGAESGASQTGEGSGSAGAAQGASGGGGDGSSASEGDGSSSGAGGVMASAGGSRSAGGHDSGEISMDGLPTWFWFSAGLVLLVMAGMIVKPMFDKK